VAKVFMGDNFEDLSGDGQELSRNLAWIMK
jgi:hypothetical protein